MADLVICVNDNYPPDKSFEYLFATDQQVFEVVNRLFPDAKRELEGGEYITRFVSYRETGTAQFVRPGQTRAPTLVNVMKKLTIGWCHTAADYGVLREQLLAAKGDSTKLIDHIKGQRMTTQVDLAAMIERAFWEAPSSTDDRIPYNAAYYIVPITGAQVTAGTGAGAFQGQNPTGFSTVAGIDGSDSTYSRWRNWNSVAAASDGSYTNDDEDRLGRMFRHLNFEAPATAEDLSKPAFQNRRMYLNETSLQNMERAAKNQNANVGWDLAYAQGRTTFKGMPLKWIPSLDTYRACWGYYPIIMLNFAYLYPVVRREVFFNQSTYPATAEKPDLTVTWVDVDYNIICTNRQQVGGVHSYVAAA